MRVYKPRWNAEHWEAMSGTIPSPPGGWPVRAKYDGQCGLCSKGIHPGQWITLRGGGKAVHNACVGALKTKRLRMIATRAKR
jgi:hypothetical protein